jgi:hypothetical protein
MRDYPEVFDDGDDGERGVAALRKYLTTRTGLSEDAIDEACEIAQAIRERGEVTDALPTSGPGGMRNALNKQSREGGETIFRSPGHFEKRPPLGTTATGEKRSMVGEAEYRSSPASDSASCLAKFPDAARIGHTYGSSQFDNYDRSTVSSRQLAADAASEDAGKRLKKRFGKHFSKIGVGDWPSRR